MHPNLLQKLSLQLEKAVGSADIIVSSSGSDSDSSDDSDNSDDSDDSDAKVNVTIRWSHRYKLNSLTALPMAWSFSWISNCLMLVLLILRLLIAFLCCIWLFDFLLQHHGLHSFLFKIFNCLCLLTVIIDNLWLRLGY